MSQHLGYVPGQAKPEGAANHRNGKSAKTVLTDTGAVAIEVPRDRAGSFEPQLIGKHERRFTGFDDKIIADVCTRHDGARNPGLSGADVLGEGLAGSHQQGHRCRDSEVAAWQSRPLETMYPVVFFDALRVKIREDAVVRSKAVYLALGILADGSKDILGLWIENTEGASSG